MYQQQSSNYPPNQQWAMANGQIPAQTATVVQNNQRIPTPFQSSHVYGQQFQHMQQQQHPFPNYEQQQQQSSLGKPPTTTTDAAMNGPQAFSGPKSGMAPSQQQPYLAPATNPRFPGSYVNGQMAPANHQQQKIPPAMPPMTGGRPQVFSEPAPMTNGQQQNNAVASQQYAPQQWSPNKPQQQVGQTPGSPPQPFNQPTQELRPSQNQQQQFYATPTNQTTGNYPNNSSQYLPNQFGQMQIQQSSTTVNLLQDARSSVFSSYEPPIPVLPAIFEYPNVNCSPDLFRCTLTAVPQTQELLKASRLPFGLVLHPFKDMKQLSVLQSSLIVRCRSCRTYINPFVSFPDQRHWKCNLCGRINDLPDEFHFDPATKTYGDAKRRPEIKNATVEFIAPAEYMPVRKNLDNLNEVRSPQPPVYLFILDVSAYAVETGYLESFCNKLVENIDHLPGDQRILVGFLAVDSNLHFYYIQEGRFPKEFVVSDLDEIFLPWHDGLLVNLIQNKEAIVQFLQYLPDFYKTNRDPHCALGAALNTAHSLLADTGGRITVMQTVLPDIGPGALTSREDPNLRSARDIANLGPATDFYKRLALDCCAHQVAVDLFMLNSQYADISTLSEIAKFSGGCIHHYPSLHVIRNCIELKRYEDDLSRYFSRKIGFEAVLRIRCSKGLALHSFHGNFFVRSTDLLALPNVNPDSACGIQVVMEDNLNDCSTVCFQAALLYTSSRGERRIRVHTLCLPVKRQLSDIHYGADAEAIASLLAKLAVDRSIAGSLSDAREAMVNACIDALGSFNKLHSSSQRSGTVLAPVNLRHLPLYVLGLLKHPAFTYGTSIKLDRRVYWMCSFKTLPIDYFFLQIYPSLYALHLLDQKDQMPPLLQLSYEKIDRHGVYLLDTGEYLYVYIGKSVSEAFCQNVFGVPHFSMIDQDMDTLPTLENEQGDIIRSFIKKLTSKRPFSSPLRIIREDSPSRDLFVQKLVDDRCESTFSYIEFLQHIQKELTPR